MRRTFAEHHVRPVYFLDGLWTLRPQDGSGTAYSAWVPGVWDRIPALARFRGVADYERAVEISESGDYLLRIGAVSHTGLVFWDDQPVGQHYNAFTGFDILLPQVAPGTHTLRIQVDDRFSEDSTLHIPNDYYTYGGLNRSVELQKIASLYIQRLAFHSVKGKEGYTAVVKAYVQAVSPVSGAQLKLSLAGAELTSPLPDLSAGETVELSLSLPVGQVQEWDVLQPHLYFLKAELLRQGEVIDDLIDRVGFRTVEIAREQLLLNGKPVHIQGFNRHEDHELFGSALPVEATAQDIQMLLDLGANSVRTCHYPNDPRFLDLCDEAGLLVWEEHHARALPIEILQKPLFAQQEAACNEEMITQHVNHPCIYIWGVLNECESETEAGRAIYEAQLSHLRRLDPTRPVSYASCRFMTDICMDLVDVVSWNIYPGWYVKEPVSSYADRLLQWIEEHGAAGKPVLITEVGAGAIAGFHDPFGQALWSEERQCTILREQLTALLGHPRLSGVYLWQFADVNVAEEWAMSRPKSQNNKGVVTSLRQPKLSYATVKELFHQSL
ncbi:MAG: beta-glucuronidase [Clostridia bacterium]|nr:beta-glucuronidase [Clostridia bacterium]